MFGAAANGAQADDRPVNRDRVEGYCAQAVARPQRIVYQQKRADWESNGSVTNLWVANVGSGTRHRLSVTGTLNFAAAWSPDGRWIAFISDSRSVLSQSPERRKQYT